METVFAAEVTPILITASLLPLDMERSYLHGQEREEFVFRNSALLSKSILYNAQHTQNKYTSANGLPAIIGEFRKTKPFMFYLVETTEKPDWYDVSTLSAHTVPGLFTMSCHPPRAAFKDRMEDISSVWH